MLENGTVVVNEVPKVVIICPKCGYLCYDIAEKILSDGNYWTVDTCWHCGADLPKVRVEYDNLVGSKRIDKL